MQIFFRHFPSDLFPEFAKQFNLRRRIWRRGYYDPRSLKKLATKLSMMNQSGQYHLSWCNILAMDFVMATLSGLPQENESEPTMSAGILRALEYMEQHYAEPVGVTEFAAAAGYSIRRFSTRFRLELQDSPMHFFSSIRLGHAHELLIHGSSTSETAHKCGFSCPQYFCRCFQLAFGISPGEFQRNPFHQGI